MTHRRMFNSTWYAIPVLMLTFLTLGTGCSSFSADEESGGDAPLQQLTYESLDQSAPDLETVDEGAYGGDLVKGTRRVIRDSEAFATFWNSLHANQTPTPSVPEVDFAEKMVLAVVLGQRPSGGYQAEITSVTRNMNPTVVRAFVTETVPGSTCVTTNVITVPYHLVAVDAVDAEQITFPDNGTQTTDCNS